jgi:hypothetical protein
MGWLFTQGQTRRELIEKRIARQENEYGIWECVAHTLRGNCLWKVVNYTKKENGFSERFIGLDLLGSDGDYGWGYKDMEECMGPHYYTCPLKYLEMAPEPDNQYAKNWREKVKAYHARMNRKFEIGQWVELYSSQVPTIKIIRLNPLRGQTLGGLVYRIPKRLIK